MPDTPHPPTCPPAVQTTLLAALGVYVEECGASRAVEEARAWVKAHSVGEAVVVGEGEKQGG